MNSLLTSLYKSPEDWPGESASWPYESPCKDEVVKDHDDGQNLRIPMKTVRYELHRAL